MRLCIEVEIVGAQRDLDRMLRERPGNGPVGAREFAVGRDRVLRVDGDGEVARRKCLVRVRGAPRCERGAHRQGADSKRRIDRKRVGVNDDLDAGLRPRPAPLGFRVQRAGEAPRDAGLEQRRELGEMRCVECRCHPVAGPAITARRDETCRSDVQVDRRFADERAREGAVGAPRHRDTGEPAAGGNRRVAGNPPCRLQNAGAGELAIERSRRKRTEARGIEPRCSGVDCECPLPVERDVAAHIELRVAGAGAEAFDSDDPVGDRRSKRERESARQLPIDEIAAHASTRRAELSRNAAGEARRNERRIDSPQVEVAHVERPGAPRGVAGERDSRAPNGPSPAFELGRNVVKRNRVRLPGEACGERAHRRPPGVEVAGERVGRGEFAGEPARSRLRARSDGEPRRRQRWIPRNEIEVTDVDREFAQWNRLEWCKGRARASLRDPRRDLCLDGERSQRAGDIDVGARLLPDIPSIGDMPCDRKRRASPELRLAVKRATGRRHREAGDAVLDRAAAVPESKAFDGAFRCAETPVELCNAEPLDRDVDRQCEIVGERVSRAVGAREFERQLLRAQSVDDDPA